MLTERAGVVSIAALAPRVDACELCATPDETLRATVTVRHAGGGAVSMAACDRCAAAMRRVLAVAGGAPALVSADRVGAATASSATETSTAAEALSELVGSAVLILEFAEPVTGPDGLTYAARAWGQARADGTWIGWLTFVARGGQVVRKTPRETTQSSREHLLYWATGVQPSYLEGAFQRATPA